MSVPLIFYPDILKDCNNLITDEEKVYRVPAGTLMYPLVEVFLFDNYDLFSVQSSTTLDDIKLSIPSAFQMIETPRTSVRDVLCKNENMYQFRPLTGLTNFLRNHSPDSPTSKKEIQRIAEMYVKLNHLKINANDYIICKFPTSIYESNFGPVIGFVTKGSNFHITYLERTRQ